MSWKVRITEALDEPEMNRIVVRFLVLDDLNNIVGRHVHPFTHPVTKNQVMDYLTEMAKRHRDGATRAAEVAAEVGKTTQVP